MGKWLFILAFILCGFLRAYAQVDTLRLGKDQILVLKDSVIIPDKDTLIVLGRGVKYRIKPNPYTKSEAFYQKLKNKSEKSRLSRDLYDLLVRDTTNNALSSKKAIKSEDYFREFNGYRILKIRFQPVQMITGSVGDTLRRSDSRLVNIADRSHRKTRERIIRNNLLFREGDALDPFLMADSERILRNYSFINDARIYLLPSLDVPDAVEVIVATQDRFPWNIDLSYSSINKYNFILSQDNLLGSANSLQAGFYHSKNDSPVNGYYFGFVSAPIKRTFTRVGIYAQDNYREKSRGIVIEKPFVSPVIKYGGSLEIGEVSRNVSFNLEDSTYDTSYDLNGMDLWLARAWRPFRNDRKTISLGIRGVTTKFDIRPVVESDSNIIFHDRNTILTAVDYNKSNFVKTTNVFTIGITEDLPVGYSFGATLGGNFTEFRDEWYLGLRWQWNTFISAGYFRFYTDIGGFRDVNGWSEGISINQLDYLSPLFGKRRSTRRLFARVYYIKGLALSLPLSIRLRDYIKGLNGYFTQGNEVAGVRIEYIWFTRWYWLGFRFAPYTTGEVGMVSENRIENKYREFYPAIGGGLRITNPGLFLRSLGIGMKVFPSPAPDGDVFYFDISLNARIPFRINTTVKPVVLPYQQYNIFR